MDDGSEAEFGPGDVGLVPPGHDAWVVGDEPVVVIDIGGMQSYGEAGLIELLQYYPRGQDRRRRPQALPESRISSCTSRCIPGFFVWP